MKKCIQIDEVAIKVPHLKNLEVNIPALSIQRKIAQVLCNIDEKIRQNKRINENLSDNGE